MEVKLFLLIEMQVKVKHFKTCRGESWPQNVENQRHRLVLVLIGIDISSYSFVPMFIFMGELFIS